MNDKFKIIFLDIDGVLNSEEWYIERLTKKLSYSYPMREFSPNLIKNFNKLIDKTGASVVISSTWRMGRSIDELKQLFESLGIKGKIIGKTPILRNEMRGEEIKSWLNTFERTFITPENKLVSVNSYVIIDDDNDMLPEQKSSFFKTKWKYGLTENIVDECIDYLNKGREELIHN